MAVLSEAATLRVFFCPNAQERGLGDAVVPAAEPVTYSGLCPIRPRTPELSVHPVGWQRGFEVKVA